MPPAIVYLTGFMGSGKSSVGASLAGRLQYRFTDLDHVIEQEAGRPITDIFRDDGEAAFRRLERETLLQLSRSSHLVVALGGGALIDPACRQCVAETGTLVYLRATLETIYDRVKHRKHRPLLLDSEGRVVSREAFEDHAGPLLEARRDGYEAADLTVEVDHRNMDAIVEDIQGALNG